MEILFFVGILVLVLGGCVCVVWGARGGPRWVRGVAHVTLAAGELLRKASSSKGSSSSGQSDGSDGSDGS